MCSFIGDSHVIEAVPSLWLSITRRLRFCLFMSLSHYLFRVSFPVVEESLRGEGTKGDAERFGGMTSSEQACQRVQKSTGRDNSGN